MDEVIEIENYIDANCVRHLHLMSNVEFGPDDLSLPDGVPHTVTKEAGVYHLRASWKAREAFAGTMRGSDRWERLVVLWHIDGKISTCARDAAHEFMRVFGRVPDFAAVCKIPRAAEQSSLDIDIPLGDGLEPLALVESHDIPERFVMVY